MAISLRRLADNAFARALPPLLAPNLPNATAAGFFWRGGSGAESLGIWPVAIWIVRKAVSFTSRVLRLGLCIQGILTRASMKGKEKIQFLDSRAPQA